MVCSRVELAEALAAHVKEKGAYPDMSHDALAKAYPVHYQSLLQIIHSTGERVNDISAARQGK